LRFHQALVLIDDELQLPAHYQAFSWPAGPGQKPQLLEEFSITDWRFNVPLGEQHFYHKFSGYGFNKRKEFQHATPNPVRRGR
jgi:hypothetical protein